MRSTIAPCVLGLTLLAGGSCRVNVGKPAQPATGAEPAKPTKEASPEPQAKTPKPKRTNPTSTTGTSVWAHFVMATPDKSIEKMRNRLAPPPLAMFVDSSQIAEAFAAGFGGSPNLSKNFDLDQSFGCALVNPDKFEEPFVCAFGYNGGLRQLIVDLGPENYESGGDGYASYLINDERIFLRAFGSHVAVATEPTLLASTADYIDANLIRGSKDAPDVFAEVHPSLVFTEARDKVDEFLDEIESSMSNNGGMPGADYAKASAKSTRQMYESFGDLKKVTAAFNVGKQRTKLTYRATATKDTLTAEQYELAAAAPPIEVSLIHDMPDDVFIVGGTNFDVANLHKEPWMNVYLNSLEGLKTSTGEDLGTIMRSFMTRWANVMEGPVAMGMFPASNSAGVLAASYAIQPGKDAKTLTREFVEKYPLDKFIPEYRDLIQGKYKKDAFSIGKTKVDTYTIKPTASAKKKMVSNSNFDDIKAALGKVQFVMAFAQKGDRMYLVMTTNNVKKAMGRVLSAANGKGNLGKFGTAKKIVGKHSDGSMLALFDVAAMLDWVESFKINGFDRDIVKNGALDDIVLTGRITKRGKREFEMSMSQDLIDQLRTVR